MPESMIEETRIISAPEAPIRVTEITLTAAGKALLTSTSPGIFEGAKILSAEAPPERKRLLTLQNLIFK